MIGFVDDDLRALIKVQVAASPDGERVEIAAWVDTAFNGALVIPRTAVTTLRLTKEASTEAILADGRVVELETYLCSVDWFGRTYNTQVTINESQFALLGTMLLDGRRLTVDYISTAVELT